MVEWGQRVVEKKGLKGYALAMQEAATSTWRFWGSPKKRSNGRRFERRKKKWSILHWNAAEQRRESMDWIGKKKFMEKEHGKAYVDEAD